MDSLGIATVITLLAGLSTGVGALLAIVFPRGNTRALSAGLGFSAGVMIYVSFMEILPKSKAAFATTDFANWAGLLVITVFFSGFLGTMMIDALIPKDVNPHDLKADMDHGQRASANLHRTGLFTALAIAIHNFPEGFAAFTATLQDPQLGVTVALAIAIHNIPEGMAISLPIYHATGNRKLAVGHGFLSGLSEPVGAIAGYFLLMPILGDMTLAITFALVAGIMIYISFEELLPQARACGNGNTSILGIGFGMVVMALSLEMLS